MHVVVFEVERARYAVEVERLVEVLPRVRITPLPGAPPFVEGLFVHRERPCVTVSMRARFGHAPRTPSLEDHLLVVRGRTRVLALLVDRVVGDAHVDARQIEPPPVPTPRVKGVVAVAADLLLLHDLDALLSPDEDAALARCLDEAGVR